MAASAAERTPLSLPHATSVPTRVKAAVAVAATRRGALSLEAHFTGAYVALHGARTAARDVVERDTRAVAALIHAAQPVMLHDKLLRHIIDRR